jgi:hypothetical protein
VNDLQDIGEHFQVPGIYRIHRIYDYVTSTTNAVNGMSL